MNLRLKLFVTAVTLMLAAGLSYGQTKVYTKKMLLADFPTKTTKVVITGDSPLGIAIRGEISSRWRVSPFEFCTEEEYEKLKTGNSHYFIRLVSDSGVAFLELTKGGKPDDPDRLKRPVDVVSIPIAGAGGFTGDEVVYMGAFIDMMQVFLEEAASSDKVGYSGLMGSNARRLKGKHVVMLDDEVFEAYQEARPDVLIAYCVTPSETDGKRWCYHMLISADTHELYYFKKIRYKGEGDEVFTASEISFLEKRNAIVVR